MVVEQLGLRHALDCVVIDGTTATKMMKMMTTMMAWADGDSLSNELFRCTVCTSRNQCIVSVFVCVGEVVLWQVEGIRFL